MEDEANVQHFWELALATHEVSSQLSKSMVSEMLETVKMAGKPIPGYFKKLFCFKCFTLFVIGKNCKVTIHSHRKHPNLKITEYNCLECQNTQRINLVRSKENRAKALAQEKPIEQSKDAHNNEKTNEIKGNRTQQKRKLFTSIFK